MRQEADYRDRVMRNKMSDL